MLAVVRLLLLAGCSKKENTEQSNRHQPPEAASPARSHSDRSGHRSYRSGTVKFDGTAPKPAKIDMSQDPGCKGTNDSRNGGGQTAATWPMCSFT